MRPEGGWTADSISYVHPQPDGAPDAWTAEARQLGRTGSQQLLRVGEVDSPPAVEPLLGARSVLRRRLILLDGAPVEIADSYYPCELAVGTALAEPLKIRGGAPTLLASLGCAPAELVEELTVRPAGAAEAHLLGVGAGSAVVELVRATRDAGGRPYEVAVMVMRPEGRVFRYRMAMGAESA
ncbi:UTRA domain-containing protein [Catellatospora sp. KI3]|uniref:UTRA domain-containing protein n=1 Tax=Catellatospora sp. KI3 TaxID=3041620 RepID=UPI0024821A31|nr:UTRA domain-containing protein [Catellatospora sp. KI3]MDI1459449.1 UTRA domain-containing protein [Catellatospora sp. KI3]